MELELLPLRQINNTIFRLDDNVFPLQHAMYLGRTIVRFDILDVLNADTVAKMTTREIGDYAREQMLQSEPATPTKKEAITV